MQHLRGVPPAADDEAERADLIAGLDRLATTDEPVRQTTRLRHRRILEIHAEHPTLLQREIAAMIGCTQSMVSAVLKRAEGG
jgi:DNA-binding MarR family transcriptional regulator